MPDLRSIGLAASKGLAGASGNAATADRAQQDIDEGKAAKQQKLQMQIAPLSMALKGFQAHYQDTLDEHGNVIAGKEHEAEAAKDAMADIVGKIRHIIVPPPKEDPHGLGYLAHAATDKLHITRHALEEASARQKAKLAKYDQQTTDTTKAITTGTVPYAMTEEGKKLQLQEKLRKDAQATKYANYMLPDGKTIVTIDENHQTPPEGAHKVGSSIAAGQARALGQGIGVSHAIQAMQASGQRYMKDDGTTPWTVEELQKFPVSMKLSPLSLSGKLVYVPSDQSESRFVVGNKVYLKDQFGDIDLENPLGDARTGSTSVDAFGVKTSTTPTSPGATGSPSLNSAPDAGKSSANPAPKSEGPKAQSLRKMQKVQSNSGPKGKQLDSQGSIPSNAANPNLVSAANELLHGKSQKDLQVPQKDKQAAAALATQYGYLGEGMWTPREQMQVNQSQQLLDSLRKDADFMSVYQEGPVKRAAIATAIEKSKEHGIKANLERTLINMGLDEKDVRFVQSYQNLIGRIQGLALLTRGSGRPTEAAVNRMMQELPNVITAQSKEEAEHAFDLIQNEIDIGMGAKKPAGAKTQQLQQTKEQGADPLGVL